MGADRDFETFLQEMYSRDPQTAESGFSSLEQRAAEFKVLLLEEYELASRDPVDQFPLSRRRNCRGWLLELLSGIGSEDLQSLFEAALADEEVRHWAIRGLRIIDTKASRRVLWEAGLSGK